jgi:HlyD family secretion protein
MNNRLFRQVSLARLSSPEQLDAVLRVTSPKEWLGLLAIFLILTIALIWGNIGSIPTTASGRGVIVRRGGVLNVVTQGSGLVVKLNVKVGDVVKANQVVATIAQPVLAEKMKTVAETLAESVREREHALQVRTNAVKLQAEAVDRQRANAERQIDELEQQAKVQTDQIDVEEKLLGKGLVTQQQALAAKQKLITLQDEIAAQKAQIKQFDAQEFTLKSQPQQEDAEMRAHISSLERDMAGMEEELTMTENVVSPYGGEVLELEVYPGSTVAAAQPVLSIQPDEQSLELLAYLPSSQVKDARRGMEVQVSPSVVKREEFGFMQGEVTYVSNFPATNAALMRNFENEPLVVSLTNAGPVTEIRVALKPNPHTPSGFSWSTPRGPSISITSGTICSVQIVTHRQRPISLLFPYIKDKFGLS